MIEQSRRGSAPTRTVAVLGAGSAGRRHLRAFAAAGARTVAVTRRPAAAAELRRDGIQAFAALEDAARAGASACVIATETSRHRADAERALALGLDVLIEKPAAARAADARAVARAASRARRRAFVACVLRFSPSLNRFRALLPRLGRLHAVRVECRSFLPDWRPARPYRRTYSARAGEGGVLLDLIHELDYSGWIFGFPRRASGLRANLGRLGIDSDECAELSWRLPRGGFMTVGLDYLTREPRRGIVADGERGTLRWDALAGRTELRLAGRAPIGATDRETADSRFRAQAEAFLSGRADDRLATLEDAAAALELAASAREARS